MNVMQNSAPERQEIEELLPWHAAGTLSRRDAQRVEQALANDAELARHYALVREELAETIHLNETLGAPSARAMERLLAGIEAESGPARQSRFSFGTWLSEKLAELSPRKLAYAATAATMLIAVQAGVLGSMFLGEQDVGYRGIDPHQTASKTPTAELGAGTFALAGFAPQATSADITRFLEMNQLVVVDGPRPGGLYRLRIWVTPLPKDEATRITTRLGSESGIIRFIAPTDIP